MGSIVRLEVQVTLFVISWVTREALTYFTTMFALKSPSILSTDSSLDFKIFV